MEISIIDPDARRFTRAGRPLRHWLWQLVDADLNRRHRAARYVSKMHSESTEMPPDVDYEKYLATFDRKVQDAVGEPAFDGRTYVGRLADVMRESQAEQERLGNEEQARVSAVTDRIEAQIEATTDESRKRSLGRRLIRASCAGMDCRTPTSLAKQKHSFVSITIGFVFGALGEHALASPATVRRMLVDERTRYYAIEAIRRASPAAAAPYADDLLDMLAVDDNEAYGNPLVRAVATAIAQDGDRVRELFDRALSADGSKASVLLSVFAYIGPPVRVYVPDGVDRLAELAARDDNLGWSAAQALGKVMAIRRN